MPQKSGIYTTFINVCFNIILMIKDKKICFDSEANCYTLNSNVLVKHFYLCTKVTDKVTPIYEVSTPIRARQTKNNKHLIYSVENLPYCISDIDFLKTFDEYNIKNQYDITTESLYYIVDKMIINDFDCLEVNLLHETINTNRVLRNKMYIENDSYFEVALNKDDTECRLEEIRHGNYVNSDKALKFLLNNEFININIDDDVL